MPDSNLTINVEAFNKAVSSLAGHPLLPATARVSLTLAGQVMAGLVTSNEALSRRVARLESMLGADLDRLLQHTPAAAF